MNQTIEVLTNRASIRSYLDKPISNQHLELINEAIFRSPTAGNMQDFSVIVVDEPELKAKLSVLCDNQLFIKNSPLLYIFVMDFSRHKRYFELSKVDDSQFKVPHYGSMMNGIVDATIAAQTASVAANSLGIGTCYIGDITENYEDITSLLNLDSNMIPVAMLTMGYFEQEIKLSRKFDKQYIFHQNKYQHLSDQQIFDIFSDRKVPKKYQNQYENFGQYYYATKVGADFSAEMHRSMAKYISNFSSNPLKTPE